MSEDWRPITTEVIEKYMLLDAEKYEGAKAREELARREQKVAEKEGRMLGEGHVCPVGRAPVTTQSLRQDLKKNFYDAEKMKHVWCTVDSALYSLDAIPDDLRAFVTSDSEKQSPMMHLKTGLVPQKRSTPQERCKRVSQPNDGTNPSFVRQSLKNLSLIGKPSADGIAASADFGGVKRGFVLKTPKKGKDPELLTHELIVGTELNKLRRHIPNFALVFGGFKCSPPELSNDRKTSRVRKWCETTADGVRYVLYENVFIDDQELNADFRDFVKSCTTEKWLQVYVQTLLALQFATEAVGFTHNDLHTENILVRETDQPLLVPYGLRKGTYYTYSKLIPTFIDYGRSVLQIDGEWFGDYTQAGFGSNPEGACPLQDAYKLLMFSLADLQDANPAVFMQVSRIFQYFNTEETVTEALAAQRPFYYVVPYEVPGFCEEELYGLIDYVVESFPHLNLVHDANIVPEVGAVCPTGVAPTDATCRGSVAARETLVNYTQPQNLEELYEVAPFAPDTELERMVANFPRIQEQIDEVQRAVRADADALEDAFARDRQYSDGYYQLWEKEAARWREGGADMREIAEMYNDLRDDALAYLAYLSVLAALYQHAKVLDFAEARFLQLDGSRWQEDIRGLYDDVMAESVAAMFAVLGVALDYLKEIDREYSVQLEGEFDTPIDLLQDYLEPYVERKYLDACIDC